MAPETWSEADDRARAVQEVRNVMKRTLGIETAGLTDDEVVRVFTGRLNRFVVQAEPIISRLRAAGLLVEEGSGA